MTKLSQLEKDRYTKKNLGPIVSRLIKNLTSTRIKIYSFNQENEIRKIFCFDKNFSISESRRFMEM